MIFDFIRPCFTWHRLGFGGGSSGGQTVSQEFKPPEWTTSYGGAGQGPWQDYVRQATELSQKPYQSYPGQTIADLAPGQLAGMDLATQRAILGAPDLNAARGQVMQTEQGAYLNSNPWLQNDYTNQVIQNTADQMANAYALGTGAQTDAAFARGGAFGGSAYNQMQAMNAAGLGQQVANMANQYQLARTGLGATDYSNERNRMLQAAPIAGQLSQDDWTAAQALTGVGDVQRQYTQDLLNQGLNAWNQSILWPNQQLDALGNALARASGNVAGGYSSTATQPYQASPFASLLGLGAGAYGAYNLLKS